MDDNTTTDTHPLLRLLGHTDIGTWLYSQPLVFFTELEAALIADNKSLDDTGEHEAMFKKPIADTGDIFQNQSNVIFSMVEGWTLSVMNPLLEDIKNCTDIKGVLYLTFESDGCDIILSFDNIESFTQKLEPNNVDDLKAVLAAWSNSAALIDNLDEFNDALNGVTQNGDNDE